MITSQSTTFSAV